MTEDELRSYLDRVAGALEGMAPVAPGTNWPVLIAAFLAFLIGIGTIWQKSLADSRAEWWRRVQWALEASAAPEDDPLSDYGVRMLKVLAKKRFLVPKKDKELFDAVWQDSSPGLSDEEIDQLDADASRFTDTEGLDGQTKTGENEGKEDSHA